MDVKIRLATINDIYQLARLYHEVYEGLYPDPMMKDLIQMEQFISDPRNFWVVSESGERIVGSVIYVYNEGNLLAKVYGAVVHSSQRGQRLTQRMMAYGFEVLVSHTKGLDLVYATTRTVHETAQALTEEMGYVKLGIFPNVHRTNRFETHGLTALIQESALRKRHANYKIHQTVKSLVDLCLAEMKIPTLEAIVPDKPTRKLLPPPLIELVEAENFALHRYAILKAEGKLKFQFFPFHEPNVMILSPNQSVEIFLHINRLDGHCVIVGGKVEGDISFTSLFLQVGEMMRKVGARYLEILVRADKPKIVDSILNAKFIPCAFVPAFQLEGSRRIDYLVLSRTFEVLDFQDVKLKGINQKYLEVYFDNWMQSSLNSKLLKHEKI